MDFDIAGKFREELLHETEEKPQKKLHGGPYKSFTIIKPMESHVQWNRLSKEREHVGTEGLLVLVVLWLTVTKFGNGVVIVFTTTP